jgi:hypothetical protein
MTPDLIHYIIQAATREDPNTFYSSSRKESVKFSHSLIYKYFAMYIHIQVRQNSSTTQHSHNPLCDSFIQTQHHFQTLSLLNLLLLAKLYSHFFTRNFFFILNLILNLAIITKVMSSILTTGWQEMRNYSNPRVFLVGKGLNMTLWLLGL